MNISIDLKERRDMRYMGWVIKAVYKTYRGVPFTKYFRNSREWSEFTQEAEKLGTIFVASMSL